VHERAAVRAGAPEHQQPFTGLALDWRRMLFPTASDSEFADGYAQAVTFALLLARSEGRPQADREPLPEGAGSGARRRARRAPTEVIGAGHQRRKLVSRPSGSTWPSARHPPALMAHQRAAQPGAERNGPAHRGRPTPARARGAVHTDWLVRWIPRHASQAYDRTTVQVAWPPQSAA